MKKMIEIELDDVTDQDYGDSFSIDDFIELVDEGSIMDYDGIGYLAILDEKGRIYESEIMVLCDSTWLRYSARTFNAVMWYNR